ncbi:CBS domain-containing protein [Streptomyces sp. ICC4]|uniref:CBS domain-containing protein n=1 Tax=Streptomyces sp. ICC4 TaxID=2099584 RepID=UPI001EF82599|nr:CBS domain-containing protein [Streptomyces sp. ICC4]
MELLLGQQVGFGDHADDAAFASFSQLRRRRSAKPWKRPQSTRIRAWSLSTRKPITVDAGADTSQVLQTMQDHRIRRVPVIAEHRLVGMIGEADLARHLSDEQVGHFVETICAQR